MHVSNDLIRGLSLSTRIRIDIIFSFTNKYRTYDKIAIWYGIRKTIIFLLQDIPFDLFDCRRCFQYVNHVPKNHIDTLVYVQQSNKLKFIFRLHLMTKIADRHIRLYSN